MTTAAMQRTVRMAGMRACRYDIGVDVFLKVVAAEARMTPNVVSTARTEMANPWMLKNSHHATSAISRKMIGNVVY